MNAEDVHEVRGGPRRVAIVGGGASGLVACHRFASEPLHFVPIVFEQNGTLGGTWVYTDETGTNEFGVPIHSSMYKHLTTNLPKELMAFLDFPFTEDGPSHISHERVLGYLQTYYEHFQLSEYFRFYTKVVNIKPVSKLWTVEVEDVRTKTRETFQFDNIVVSNGHNWHSRRVDIQGLNAFTGTVLHSHSYRVPEPFAEKNVLCIGAGWSGIDIASDLCKVAKTVALSYEYSERISLPIPNKLVVQFPRVTSAVSNGFHFNDGRFFAADVLIFCTGYEYSFPFLDLECGVSVVEHRVTPIYKHLIHITHPSLALLSLPFTVVPFVVADVQSQFLVRVFKNPEQFLPSTEEMTGDTNAEIVRRSNEGYKNRHFHKFAQKIWNYLYDLIEMVGLERLPPFKEKLHILSFEHRRIDFCTFRELNYGTTKEDVFLRPSNHFIGDRQSTS